MADPHAPDRPAAAPAAFHLCDRVARERAEVALAPAATRSAASRGRTDAESPDRVRTAFEVDRDRILHTKAFRRLAHKTQVVVGGSPGSANDHVVTRLTHALQVTQVARALAAGLGLNEPLAEAVALGHDVGHAPFGHTGEEALRAFVPGWHHATQGVRVLEVLEARNLTWEVRDGIRAHSWSVEPPPATPEAQCVRFADRIAYLSHDALDALRFGTLGEADFPPLVRQALGPPSGAWIGRMVDAVLASSATTGLVSTDPDGAAVMDALRDFLFARVYRSERNLARQGVAAAVVHDLVEHLVATPADLPPAPPRHPTADVLTRAVDHVAGMTDRYAIAAHRARFGPDLTARLVAAP